ncbi:hypothetical protein [Solicola gregarius]|uniref:Uncharacterized protein n=1 Tax=Solicola gregarius TaxID=2908642 RepID=A0AA46YJW1_9ACTN|nr:hypothetical protein [Solicola gregarius]UYM03911.1 hypothetical protein L0C25_15330 [Solicola gregarius]
MNSPDRGSLRVVRAAAVALCVVGLSLVGHLSAGGSVPGPEILLGSSLVVAAYAAALTRNRLGRLELVGVLGAGQLLLHTAFMTSGGHSGGLTMLAAHAFAAVVIALVLARGEDAAWALWCWLRPRLVMPASDLEPPVSREECLAATAATRVRLTWIGTSLTWRGPPALTRDR